LDAFVSRPAWRVARDLLGTRLRVTAGDGTAEGVIVETEAYLGPEDEASHAATRSGVTERNRLMFGRAGILYVYRSYGVHWCLNVVTGGVGDGQAVLIRGVEPLRGQPLMTRRREGRVPLAAGPGRVAQAFAVGGEANGHDLRREPLRLLPGWSLPDGRIEVTGRVGVSKAAEWPLRFAVRGSGGVSRGRWHPGDPHSLPLEPRNFVHGLLQARTTPPSDSNV
jgi:DNA-3-methyladenine glycosylase